MMRVMDTANREQIEQSIQQALAEVESDIIQLEKLTKPISPDNAIGRLTRMDAINNKSINDANLNNARRKKHQLSEMLENLNKSDFGLCRNCKEPIPIERLLLMPESDCCVRCA